jgi:hypothetical protein
VTCTLTHSHGHTESATLASPADKSGSKSDAQGIASTITLLQRYSALSLLGIATADMPEPTGETDPEAVDSARNLRAMKACSDAGHTRAEAEARTGKPLEQWTVADLDVLREWLRPAKVAEPTALDSALAKIAAATLPGEMIMLKDELAAMGLGGEDLKTARAAFKARAAELK